MNLFYKHYHLIRAKKHPWEGGWAGITTIPHQGRKERHSSVCVFPGSIRFLWIHLCWMALSWSFISVVLCGFFRQLSISQSLFLVPLGAPLCCVSFLSHPINSSHFYWTIVLHPREAYGEGSRMFLTQFLSTGCFQSLACCWGLRLSAMFCLQSGHFFQAGTGPKGHLAGCFHGPMASPD